MKQGKRRICIMAAAALLAFALCQPVRRRKQTAKSVVSSRCRETVLALFWMFCGGMAVITLTPRWVVWAMIDLVNHGIWNAGSYPFFAWGDVNLIPFQTFAADMGVILHNGFVDLFHEALLLLG